VVLLSTKVAVRTLSSSLSLIFIPALPTVDASVGGTTVGTAVGRGLAGAAVGGGIVGAGGCAVGAADTAVAAGGIEVGGTGVGVDDGPQAATSRLTSMSTIT
jgi:hypothetical protein